MILRLLLLTIVAAGMHTHAQSLIPFRFTSEEDNRLIKENDSFRFYAATGDTSCIVALGEENAEYRLYSKAWKLIADGNYTAEGDRFLQDGKWSERYANGKVKQTGYFRRGMPIGTWEEYYAGGRIKIISNYGAFDEDGQITSCLSGTYMEYYESGKVKVSGYYSAGFITESDTILVSDPTTAREVKKAVPRRKLRAAKTGRWEYLDENGELEKKEDL